MNSISEIMCLCRLCLEKEDVNTPIFEEQGEIGQISLKISTCLPVKVSKEDDLPKNICGGCLCKLEMFYQFWNTCANADKKLVKWIDQISVNKISDKRESAASNVLIQHSIDSNPIVLKQEVMEIVDTQSDDLVSEHLNMSNDDQDYLLQQQSLTYEPVEFQFQQDEFETVAEDDSSNAGVQSHSQHKRVAAMRSLSHVESEDEDDPDSMNAHITKTEDDTDDSGEGDPKPTTFVGLPPDDNVQAGTSTAVQSIRDAPSKKYFRYGKYFNTDHIKIEVDSGTTTKKNPAKCALCPKRFQSSQELAQHHFENHQSTGKRKQKLDAGTIIIKEEVIEEELNLTFSTDDEEDELEVVFNDNNQVVAEQMQKLLSEQLNSVSSSKEVEGCCVLCNNGKMMPAEQLKKHYKKHERILMHFKEQKSASEEANAYYCHMCKDGKIRTKIELKDHYQSEHNMTITNNRKFLRRARCKRPRSPRPEVFRCEICSREFPAKYLLEDHFEEHGDQYSCDICGNGFKKLIDYTFHMQGHSEDKLFKCPLCEFSTDKGYLVKSHLYSVHDQFKKYKCELCGKGFAIFTHFQEHKYFHTGEKPFQCNECGQKFMYTRYLNSHKVQMHKKSQKGIECPVCHKMYSHRNSLNTHMKSHTGSMSVCDVCGKTLSSNEKLRLHYRIHTGEKPYKCDYCNKSFKTSSYRAEHERTHTGEKPYECPFCGKGFSQRTSMVIHSRGHTGEKPYFCHLCKKGFAAKSMVTIHLKSCKGAVGRRVEND